MLIRYASLVFSLLVLALPAAAVELAALEFHGAGDILDIDQSGSLVAIASGYGIDLIDSTASGFVPLSHLDFDDQVLQVLIHGDVMYAGVLRRGLYAVDISDPTDPVVHGHVSTTGGWRNLEATGDVIVAHTSAWGWNIFIGDASDPLYPAAADSLDLDSSQAGFAIGDGYFYFTATYAHLQTWSVADPYQAVMTDEYATGDPRWTRLTVENGLLWAHGEDLTAFSLADPADPVPLSTVDEDYLLYPETAAVGSYLYRTLSSDTNDLVVYDYTVPTAPVAVDTLDGVFETTQTRNLHAVADGLLIANGTYLQRFDLADPASPAADVEYMNRATLDLAAEGGRVWVASGRAGLSCLQLDAPGGSTWSGPWSQTGSVRQVAVDGDRLALVDEQAVRLLDISDPALPTELAAWNSAAIDVDLEDGVLAYTTEGSLYIVDLDGSPDAVEIELGVSLGRVELEAGHAFVMHSADLLINVDCTVPGAPSVVGAVTLPNVSFMIPELSDLAAEGGRLVVSAFAQLDCVFDIADPAAPVFLGHSFVDMSYTFDQERSVALNGRWLLAGTGGTAHMVDLYDAANPDDVTGPTFAASDRAVWVSERRAVVCGQLGAVLLEFDPSGLSAVPSSAAPSLDLSLAPNPANPRVVIQWSLPRAGRLQVDVFDIAGRRIRNLVDGNRPSGEGSVAWDGCGRDGRAMSSGVYLVQVRTADRTETRRVALIR